MVRISVLYPAGEGKKFDVDYVHGKEIIADIPNYTNIQPQIQIREIVSG